MLALLNTVRTQICHVYVVGGEKGNEGLDKTVQHKSVCGGEGDKMDGVTVIESEFESAKKSGVESVCKSNFQSVKKSKKETTLKGNLQSVEKSVEKSSEKIVEKSVEKSVVHSVQKNVGASTENNASETVCRYKSVSDSASEQGGWLRCAGI